MIRTYCIITVYIGKGMTKGGEYLKTIDLPQNLTESETNSNAFIISDNYFAIN